MNKILERTSQLINEEKESWHTIKLGLDNTHVFDIECEYPYELFDDIYGQLGYEYDLHKELQDENIYGTSDLMEYYLSKDEVVDMERKQTIETITQNYIMIDDVEYMENKDDDDFQKNTNEENHLMEMLWLNTIGYIFDEGIEDKLFGHVIIKSNEEILLHFIEPTTIDIAINKNMTTKQVKELAKQIQYNEND